VNLSECVVLQIQATAFDDYIRATFQSMCWTENSKATNICY